MKEYYFMSGLPRSGSTLLCAILRQNPEFYTDIGSKVNSLVINAINDITASPQFFSMEEMQIKNLIYGIFDGFYKHIEKPIIFDNSRSWTRKTDVLKSLFPNTKILCTVRDIVPIINSFEYINKKNPFYGYVLSKEECPDNIFSRTESMMCRGGTIFESLQSLKEGYSCNPEIIHIIEYEDLCKYPEKTIRGVYEFLEKPYYPHDFENVEYSNENFDIACRMKGLHTIKKKVEYNPPKIILPEEIVHKYKKMNMEFWRNKNNLNEFKYN
jgi:sulfotransferase